MKIDILTMLDDHYRPVADITVRVNQDYAMAHGYTFTAIHRNFGSWAETVWAKIELMRGRLADSDWLMWIDADAMVMNHSIKIERLIEMASGGDLIISSDLHGLNAGVFLVKNTKQARIFLEQVDAIKPHYLTRKYPEQEAMNDSLDYIADRYLPTWLLNQFWLQWIPGDFIVHHAGGSVEDKVKGLTPFLEKVQYLKPCNA